MYIVNILKRIKRSIYTINFLEWLLFTNRTIRIIKTSVKSNHKDITKLHFAVIVLPWLDTIVPLFSIVSGLLFNRYGCKVTFIFDDIPFGVNPVRYKFVTYCIKKALKILSRDHLVIRLSDYFNNKIDIPHSVIDEISKLVALNATHFLRGETLVKGREKYSLHIKKQLVNAYAAIKPLFLSNKFDVIFMPGGIYGSSGIWKYCAEEVDVRVATFDSGGFNTLMLTTSGIAAQLQDIPSAFTILKMHLNDSDKICLCKKIAEIEMSKRKTGTDTFGSQIVSDTHMQLGFSNGVLIALNSSWDQAALGLHTVFNNSSQWIVDTTSWLLNNTDVPVIVRQHPVERLKIASTTDNYKALIETHFPGNDRVIFIAANDPVNSYDLFSNVTTVVVYTSTIGIEAAAQGKTVITPSTNYYSSLGFVYKSTSKEMYFNHLLGAVNRSIFTSEIMKNDAILCYYITQCCNWLFTMFNTENMKEWSLYTISELYEVDTVQLMLKSLNNNMPVAILNHSKNVDLYGA
jgi:hypothetical protein